MSVQFGRWNFEGQPPSPEYIEKVSATLAPYGPDSNDRYANGGVTMLYRAFHTTKESHREVQPHVTVSGAVITWDGRLDNRAELIGELRGLLQANSAAARATAHLVAADFAKVSSAHEFTDVEIVAAAYEKWGDKCLAKLIGDWALSIWNPIDRYLFLAKDPIGTKHLYYSYDKDHVTWSTMLDPLVLFAGKTFEICEEYVAGWFAIMFPAAHLTPYVGIHPVPPSCSLLLRPGRHGVQHTVSKYWDFDPGKRIRYRTDAEYEEHFRSVLFAAVQRRLRSDRPVLAELSGGMDSSTIVCMADMVAARSAAETPRLDTISWYDDSYDHIEPDSNELHWIAKVEERRRRPGCHINLRELKSTEADSQKPFASEFDNNHFAAAPLPNPCQSEFFKRCKAYVQSQGYRVTLSGIGGDEPTGGGVPTPTPELQDLMASARFITLARQLNAWATTMKKSPLPLLWNAVQAFFSSVPVDLPISTRPAPWFTQGFVCRNRPVFRGYPFRMKFFGPLPSFQDNIDKLENNRRLFAYRPLRSEMLYDARYPYTDRDFLEFALAIPRDQIVRVGQRRSLMRRALAEVVPVEILQRRRKAFVSPEPKKRDTTEFPSLAELGQLIIGSFVGIIDQKRFLEYLQKARGNEEAAMHGLKRTLTLEFWLRHLAEYGVLKNIPQTKTPDYYSRHSERSEESRSMSFETRNDQLPAQTKSSVS